MTLPPTFIHRERDSGFEFCPFGRVGQRGLARTIHAVIKSGEPYRPFFEGVSPGGRTSLSKGRGGA